jgi:transposase
MRPGRRTLLHVRLSEYEGTSPVLRRYRGTKIDVWKFDLIGKGKSMVEITRALIARVGVDLSKRVYQVHAVDRAGRVVLAKAMAPQRFFEWCAQLPAGCVVAMEACGGAHYVARRLGLLGVDARLVAGQFATPYRMAGKSGKNDANDAAAICEAASRPHMRFVPVKSAQQQGQLAVHRLREGFKQERTAVINRIRGLLAEFGVVFTQGPDALRGVLADALEDAGNELPGVARLALARAHAHWIEIDDHIAWCDERIAEHVRADDRARKAATLLGVGPVTASAIAASVGDIGQFANARQFGALAGAGAEPELHRWQGQPGAHHQARGHLPAHAADPGRAQRGHERGQAQRPHQPVAGAAQGARGLAEGRGGAGQQERPHPVGGAHARCGLRPEPRSRAAERQAQPEAAGGASLRAEPCGNASGGIPLNPETDSSPRRASADTLTGQTGGR